MNASEIHVGQLTIRYLIDPKIRSYPCRALKISIVDHHT